MSDGKTTTCPAPNGQQWDQTQIYLMLSDPTRRKMILSMARKGPQTATVMAGGGLKPVNNALKHLIALRAAGLVVMSENPTDGRRQLYSLSPTVPLVKTETGCVIDFGFCTVRL